MILYRNKYKNRRREVVYEYYIRKNGDYLIPNLISDPEPEGKLRKFGLMRRHYLKEHRSGIYQVMLLSGKLKELLLMMQEQAEAQFDLLVKQMA